MGNSFRGHNMEKLDGEWVYSDTKELVSETHENRPCGKCGKHKTIEGHDPCLGTLEGVINACCGHGDTELYIQFLNGDIIRGRKALLHLKSLSLINDRNRMG